ncbi:MAG: QueT transporter family protein [Clostridia bacterium]|nr:QueT transporter family protein [Clostridia bacterium]
MLNNFTTKKLATCGIISAIYVALTLVLMPLSFGAIQVRISEALTILPLIFPEAIVGLTVGCLISNLFGFGVFDVIFGTIATFLSALLTYYAGKKIKNNVLKFIVGGFFPVIINAIIIPFIFIITGSTDQVYIINFLTIFAGQFLSVYVVGVNVYLAIKKIKH